MPGLLDRLSRFDPFAAGGDGAERAAVRSRRYVLLDVFADAALEGNQLAVFPDGSGLEGERMQAVARELKLSETVFMLEPEDRGDVRLRIFTPTAELPFAGHPVLGSAVLLAAALERTAIVLETGAGPVEVEVEAGDGRVRSGRMSQPVPTWGPFAEATELLAALGVERSRLPVEIYCNGPRHIYVALDSEQGVAALDPDLRAVAKVTGEAGVSCFAGAGGRFKSRMFAPGLGVAEDPATGSAAGPLAVHLVRHRGAAPGEEIEIRQGAEIGRPSLLRARARGTAERIEQVEVAGSAVLLARGEMWLD
jgi:trans-2,3-dihydro-3-hydroxyanthranilate isomerase